MHDNPAESRSATAARRLPGRTAAGVGAVLVVALTAAWGLTTRSEPAAHADATAGRAPGGGAAPSEATPEGADESGTPDGRRFTPSIPGTRPSPGWTNDC